jgi:DNA processing protein
VVVVEAAERSGSLITASYALEQGREIFAVPGSPLDPRSKGSNRLLKDGATMATCVDDVLAALNWAPAPSFLAEDSRHTNDDQSEAAFQHEPDDSLRGIVLEKLSAAPVEIDELVRQTGAPAPAVLTILLELELAARIQRHPGARVSWI